MTNMSMESKSLDELHTMARTLGLRGYSKLRKDELIKLLKKQSALPRSHPAASPKDAGKRPLGKSAGPPRRRAAPKHDTTPARTTKTSATAEPAAQLLPQPAPAASEEERIETAKFAVTPAGTGLSPRALADSLHENIEQLPALPISTLCLLPQKPGVLFAYWLLTAPPAPLADLRLRLCRRPPQGAIEILEEVALPAMTSVWYFHIPEHSEPGEYLVHLGHYAGAGGFVTAIERGIARVPNLYASTQIDRRWWISDADFRELYRRAGGVVRGSRLGWPGGVSSQR
jgi:hypothetical protein